jgi:hypothetical protein
MMKCRLVLDISSLIALAVSLGIVLGFAFSAWVRGQDNWKVLAITALLLLISVGATAFRFYRTYAADDRAIA